ncbi:MAG TPA: toll/interleukin-1 receptor domain-containing protein [Gemmatimonadaceae bacterium]|nr:toll/interleukin-1 receptor domain-containing protein [Gemmatimonadaceae bacterium]
MPRVFLSYVSEDAEHAARLDAALSQRGIEVWRDKTKLRPGQRWQSEIRRGIQEGDFFIACFSTKYSARSISYMNEELALAVDQLRLRPLGKEWFIPVRLDNCSIPAIPIGFGETLGNLEYVDLWADFNAGVDRLMRTLAPYGGEAYLHHRYTYDFTIHASGRVDIRTEAELTVLRDSITKGGSGWHYEPRELHVEVHVLSGRSTRIITPTVSPPVREGAAYWWETFYDTPLRRSDRITVVTNFHIHTVLDDFTKDSIHALRPIEAFDWRVAFADGLRVAKWAATCDYVASYGDGHRLFGSDGPAQEINHSFGKLDKGGVYYLSWQYE